jgi:hypothetical protein
MANTSKAQLIARAKALGLKVGDDWTYRNLKEAIEIAEEDAEVAQEDNDEMLGPIDAPRVAVVPESPTPDESTSTPVSVTPVPIPTVAAPPSIPMAVVTKPTVEIPKMEPPKVVRAAASYNPAKPRVGAGRYHVLWTVTLPDGPVDSGIVDLDDAQARSLVAQGAVVHVDDYEAYLRHNATTKAVAKPQTHPAKIPAGAGRYRTIGGVMRNGQEIPHGTVAEFTATEVAALTKPGMIAIEYPD